MGTTNFSVCILEALVNAFNVVGVYTQPPRKSGRGLKKMNSPVYDFSIDRSIPVQIPERLDGNEYINFSSFKNIDFVVVAAYGLILPEDFLNFSSLGCINVHASILPRWRGAAPVQRAIMAGDYETGITIMKMDSGLDTGDILTQSRVLIDDKTTCGVLTEKLSTLGAELIVSTLLDYHKSQIEPQPQSKNGITYAKKIEKNENKLVFNLPARMVVRHINGLSPAPGSFVEINKERIKIIEAELVDEQFDNSGVVIDNNFTIACESGCIRPVTLQRSGKHPMKLYDFLRGFPVAKGTNL